MHSWLAGWMDNRWIERKKDKSVRMMSMEGQWINDGYMMEWGCVGIDGLCWIDWWLNDRWLNDGWMNDGPVFQQQSPQDIGSVFCSDLIWDDHLLHHLLGNSCQCLLLQVQQHGSYQHKLKLHWQSLNPSVMALCQMPMYLLCLGCFSIF